MGRNPISKYVSPYWGLALAFFLIAFNYQNCGRGFKYDDSGLQISSDGHQSEASINAFSNTLHPLLRTAGCQNCHGSQAPTFAVVDPAEAHRVILNNTLVNLSNPAGSKMVVKIASNHSGIPVAVATQITAQIQAWNEQILGLPAEPGPGPGPGPMAPVLTSALPTNVRANTPFTLVLRGSNFASGAVLIAYDTAGTPLLETPTVFVSAQELNLASTGVGAATYVLRIRNPDLRTSGTINFVVSP